MAQAYGIPTQECSVAQFEAQRVAGDVDGAWKGFCDCMFLEAREVTEVRAGSDVYFACVDGRCIDPTRPLGQGQVLSEAQARDLVADAARATGKPYNLRVYRQTVRSPNWFKCVYKFCALTEGCMHPTIPGLHMPFNISPMMAFSPWTDAGAAARAIPKKGAGLFYDVTALFTLDMSEFEPLRLWQTFWENPAKYALLMAKINLIPIIGPALSPLAVMTGVPFILIPPAINTCIQQGKDPVQEILAITGPGLVKFGGMIVKYFGKCGVGFNIPCGVGLVVKQAAQDQLDTGEINRVQSEAGKAIIAFLAKSGDKLVDAIINSIGDTFGSGVFAVCEAGFGAARDAVDDPGAKRVLELFRIVSGTGQRIASGISAQKSFLEIADDVAEFLLGFRPSDYFKMITEGKKQSAVDYASSAMARTGNTVNTMIERAETVSKMMDEFITSLTKLSESIGGGLDELIRAFGVAKVGISQSSDAVKQLATNIDSASRIVLADLNNARIAAMDPSRDIRNTNVLPGIGKLIVNLQGGGSTSTTTGRTSTTTPIVVPQSPPRTSGTAPVVSPPVVPPSITPPPVVVPPKAPPVTPPAKGDTGLFILGVGGFAVGGPLGAAVALGLGAALTKK